MTWRTLSVGALVDVGAAEIQTGPFGTQLSASDYVDAGIPLINVRNIGYGTVRDEKIEFVDEQTAERLASHLLEPGDIVFGRKGAVDRHLYVSEEQRRWMQGSDCIRLRFLDKDVVPRFASYAFLAPAHQGWMLAQAGNKATMASLNHDIIRRITLHLPAPASQARTVAMLATYDDLIDNNRRRIKLLEDSVRLLFDEWFVRQHLPPHLESRSDDEPQHFSVSDLCIEVKTQVLPEAIDADTPYIGLEHMPRRSITLSDWGAANDVTSAKLCYVEGDIIFGKIRPYFHKVGIAITNGVCSSDAIVMRPRAESWRPLFLALVSSDAFIAATAQGMKEGSKMPRADWKQMRAYSVSVPNQRVLSAFNGVVEPVLQQVKTLALQARALRTARDLLLPRLMSGELTV